MVDLDDIALTRQDGKQLLSNGSFDDDMARWFFTSDKYHMPWHIKSMYMNALFDQGMVGAALLGLLLVLIGLPVYYLWARRRSPSREDVHAHR